MSRNHSQHTNILYEWYAEFFNVAEGGTYTKGFDVINHDGMFEVQFWHSAGITSNRKYNTADNLSRSVPLTTNNYYTFRWYKAVSQASFLVN